MAAAAIFVNQVLVLISGWWAGHKHLPPTPDSPRCVSQGWPGLTLWPMGFHLPWAPVPSFGAESVEGQAGSTGQL